MEVNDFKHFHFKDIFTETLKEAQQLSLNYQEVINTFSLLAEVYIRQQPSYFTRTHFEANKEPQYGASCRFSVRLNNPSKTGKIFPPDGKVIYPDLD